MLGVGGSEDPSVQLGHSWSGDTGQEVAEEEAPESRGQGNLRASACKRTALTVLIHFG